MLGQFTIAVRMLAKMPGFTAAEVSVLPREAKNTVDGSGNALGLHFRRYLTAPECSSSGSVDLIGHILPARASTQVGPPRPVRHNQPNGIFPC